MPTAERACLPRSPKTSKNRSDAPFTTLGMSMKSGCGRNEAGELDDAGNLGEISARGIVELCDDVDGADARLFLSVFQ